MANDLKVNQSMIRIVQGDITALDIDAMVYYARPDLALGSGIGGAIATRGGPGIQEELKKFGRVKTTEAVITSGGNLKTRYIIHAAGPRFQEEDTEEKLRTTILNALRRAEENGVQSLAFPAMGAGFYGVPLSACAKIILDTVKEYLQNRTNLREVVFCLVDSREYSAFRERLKAIG